MRDFNAVISLSIVGLNIPSPVSGDAHETVDGGFLTGENCLCGRSIRQPRLEVAVAEGHGTIGLYVDSEILDPGATVRARPLHREGCGMDFVTTTATLCWIQHLTLGRSLIFLCGQDCNRAQQQGR
jgi:hypothetical protein